MSILRWLRPQRWLDELESRVVNIRADLFARTTEERYMSKHKITRLLLSSGINETRESLCVTGTEEEIERAAKRMATRTKECVAICIIVGHYHRRGCDEQPEGGLEYREN